MMIHFRYMKVNDDKKDEDNVTLFPSPLRLTFKGKIKFLKVIFWFSVCLLILTFSDNLYFRIC